MEFWIRQRVFNSRRNIRNLVVTGIDGHNIECKCELRKDTMRGEEWLPKSLIFCDIELRNLPFDEGTQKSLRVVSNWENIIDRQHNICRNLVYMYEGYKYGYLNLNPFYQRDLVWTLEQKQSYILNLFKDKAVLQPTIIFNSFSDSEVGMLEVLDGKQRLQTLFDFIEGKIKLPNGQDFWSLSREDNRFILGLNAKYTMIRGIRRNLTDVEKIELFLEINELGTKMDDRHLQKVKHMKEMM